jgi:hypothetical protein
LQSVIIHSANGGKGEGWHVEEYSGALLIRFGNRWRQRGIETYKQEIQLIKVARIG